ncbi:hypothetical protein Tco_0609348 [Tanacetum coccineum]
MRIRQRAELILEVERQGYLPEVFESVNLLKDLQETDMAKARLLVDEVPDTLMRLVEKLKVWNDFRWGEYIWRHLYDQILNVVNKNKWEHLQGLSKFGNYVPTYTLSRFVWSFKDSKVNLDLTPIIAEHQLDWYTFFRQYNMVYIPRTPPTRYLDLFDDYLKKLAASRKRGKLDTRDLPIIRRYDTSSVEVIRVKDRVITELNSRVLKVEAIIKVLGLECNGVFVDKKSSFFSGSATEDLYSEDDVVKVKQEEEERCRLEEQKIMEDLFFNRLKKEVRLREEKEKILKYEQEKNKRRYELMTSDHWKVRSVSIRCQGYIGDFVLGCHAKDMVALYLVMSDSDESGITYTEVSSLFEGLSNIGSPRADDHEYLELPWMPEDPYAPPSPDYVPGPEHADDEIVVEDQPDVEDASPTAQSPDYVSESDLKADPDKDDDEDPKEDPVDYPADGGDNGDDEDEPSEEDEDKEEEEHPAPADSVVVALRAIDQALSAEETKPFETDEFAATPPPYPAYRVTARISIPAPVPTLVWSDAEVAKLLVISTPPSSSLSLWSSPLPQIPSPPLPLIPSPSLPVSPPLSVSSPVHVLSPSPPPSPIRSLGYRASMIRLRAEAVSTSHFIPLPPPFILSPTRLDAPSSGIPPPLPISVSTSSPPLLLPSASRREDRPEVTLPPRKRLDRDIRRDPEREVGYGITDLWDEIVETLQGAPVSTDTELGRHMTAFETRVRQDMDEIYTRWRQRLDYPERLRGDRWMRGQVAALQGQFTALQGQQGPAGGPAQLELLEEADSSS